MPYFGAGVDNHVNLTPGPVLVFTPNPSAAAATARFVNEGTNPVYIGGPSVTSFTGLKLMPNGRVELPAVNAAVYACGGYNPASGTTTLNGALSAGATVATLTTAASFTVGSVAIFGNASGQEAAVVTGTTATAVTLATALVNDHATGVTVATGVVAVGQLHVAGGASGIA
jgi:hypothetical protein